MKLRNNLILFYIVNFLESAVFLLPIWYFFFVNYVKFSVGDAIMINTIPGLVALLFEVHSGGWADRFGRKQNYMLGLLSGIIGFSFYLWATEVYLFVISAFFIGLGYALTSGSLEALIHDHLEEEGVTDNFNKIQSNQYISIYFGRAFSSLLAGFLYIYNEFLPIYTTIFCYLIGIVLLFLIYTPKQELSQNTSNSTHIKSALKFLFSDKEMLFIIFFLGFIFYGFSNAYWFTYQPYLEYIGININNIGIIYFFISIFSALGSFFLKKLQVKFDHFVILAFMFVGLLLVSIMFSIFDNFLGLLPIVFISILFGAVMILGNTYLINKSPKSHKSTILSIFSFSASIGYFLFGTISGYMIDLFSLKIVYEFLPFLLLLILLFGIFIYKKIDDNNKLELIKIKK